MKAATCFDNVKTEKRLFFQFELEAKQTTTLSASLGKKWQNRWEKWRKDEPIKMNTILKDLHGEIEWIKNNTERKKALSKLLKEHAAYLCNTGASIRFPLQAIIAGEAAEKISKDLEKEIPSDYFCIECLGIKSGLGYSGFEGLIDHRDGIKIIKKLIRKDKGLIPLEYLIDFVKYGPKENKEILASCFSLFKTKDFVLQLEELKETLVMSNNVKLDIALEKAMKKTEDYLKIKEEKEIE